MSLLNGVKQMFGRMFGKSDQYDQDEEAKIAHRKAMNQLSQETLRGLRFGKHRRTRR